MLRPGINPLDRRTGPGMVDARQRIAERTGPGMTNMGGFDPGDLMAAPKLR